MHYKVWKENISRSDFWFFFLVNDIKYQSTAWFEAPLGASSLILFPTSALISYQSWKQQYHLSRRNPSDFWLSAKCAASAACIFEVYQSCKNAPDRKELVFFLLRTALISVASAINAFLAWQTRFRLGQIIIWGEQQCWDYSVEKESCTDHWTLVPVWIQAGSQLAVCSPQLATDSRGRRA
jgi:hypothetical protein